MPYVDFSTNKTLQPGQAETLKARFAALMADSFPGKTENWLMVKITDGCTMYFAGSEEDCVMVDIAIYGPQTEASYRKMTAAVCAMVEKECGVPARRIYVKYTEHGTWGWNGSNF